MAVILVIIHHLVGTKVFRVDATVWYLATRARVGVDLFFVVSGFIITLLLLRERRRTRSVSVSDFYIRRIRRIVPAYAAFVTVIVLTTSLVDGWTKPTGMQLIALLTFMVDFTGSPVQSLHLWTLSVEQHFYLFYPLCFLFRKNVAIWFAIGSALLIPIVRVASVALRLPTPNGEFWIFTRADGMAYGCCLAFLATSRFGCRLRLSYKSAIFVALIAIGVLCIDEMGPRTRLFIWYRVLCLHAIDSVSLAALTWIAVDHAQTLGRVLNWRPFVLVGLISYSLYLWQQPFTNNLNSWPLVLNISIMCIAGVASHLFVERPFLRRRPVAKIESGKSISSPDASLAS